MISNWNDHDLRPEEKILTFNPQPLRKAPSLGPRKHVGQVTASSLPLPENNLSLPEEQHERQLVSKVAKMKLLRTNIRDAIFRPLTLHWRIRR